MYEELVKRLRAQAEVERFYTGEEMLYSQAADAIEELQHSLDIMGDANAKLRDQAPEWIPVTERLPGSGVHVLAACRVKYVGGGGRSYVCDAFYSEHFKEQRSTEYDDIELDYDEETDEYYLPEGWWEVIRNWDEYGFVGIADFVTHWMPLPEPPKEEELLSVSSTS